MRSGDERSIPPFPPFPTFTEEEFKDPVLVGNRQETWIEAHREWQHGALEYWIGVQEHVQNGIYRRGDWEPLLGPLPFDYVPWQFVRIAFKSGVYEDRKGNSSSYIYRRKHGEKNIELLIELLGEGPEGVALSDLLMKFVRPEGRGTKTGRLNRGLSRKFIFREKTEFFRSMKLLVDVGLASKIESVTGARYRANHEVLLNGIIYGPGIVIPKAVRGNIGPRALVTPNHLRVISWLYYRRG